MNDVKKDQLVDQGEQDGNDILGGISFDGKDQMIENVAEAILNRILDDERIKAVKLPKGLNTDSRSNEVNRQYGARPEIQNNTNQSILLVDVIPDSNKALVASIKQYKWAKEYLGVIETLYEELLVENINFPYGDVDVSYKRNPIERLVSDFISSETLIRIEVFMLALLYQPTPAFIFFGTSGERVRTETPLELKKRMTRLGGELLFLWGKKDFIKRLNCNYLTRNIKILADFLREESQGGNETFTLEQDLTLGSLIELDKLLLKLKSFAEGGIYQKTPHPRLHYRVQDGDAEPIMQIIRPSHIEMTKEWGKRSKQLSEAISYFQKYKSQSILLFRSQIRLGSESERVTADQFQTFFGTSNKKAKKPNGFQGYLDFLYFWKEDFKTQEIVLDLVWVIDAAALIQKNENNGEHLYKFRNIHMELKAFLQKVINEKPEIFEEKKIFLEFEPIPLLQNRSHELTPEFLIELGDKTKWKIFEQKILPYFIFLEFFNIDYSDEIRSRFKRGQTS